MCWNAVVVYSYTCRCKPKYNDELQWTNEHTSLEKYTSHTLFSKGLWKGCERVDVGCVWEVSWRREQTATYWPQVPLTMAALLSHSCWDAQPGVSEGPSPLSGAGSHSAGIISPTATRTHCLELTETDSNSLNWQQLTHPSHLWHLVI